MDVRPLGSNIGAEVTGIDLNAPSADTAERLNTALHTHIVLVIRNQQFTPAQYRNAMRMFGEPMLQHRAKYNLPECEEVSQVISQGGFPPALNWHTDHTNHEYPPKVTSLYGVSIPSSGGDTGFANMYAAYKSLPPAEQESVSRMVTLNSMEGSPGYSDEDRARYPGGVRHPMVRIHPETARPALYFHVSKSQGIEGMEAPDVRPYLESLLKRTIKPENVYRHQWRKGDLVVADNRAAMHRAYWNFDQKELRLLWRVIIRGERPKGITH